MSIIPLPTKGPDQGTVHAIPLTQQRLQRVKAAYSTRHLRLKDARYLLEGALEPAWGDLVLARIERIGQHTRIELGCGRRAHLHLGDEVLLCYGARYAPDQFEAVVPTTLGPCDMVAAGGVAAHCRLRHRSMKQPTRIAPIGLLADAQGERLNLQRYRLAEPADAARRPPVYAVLGTMMNAGKTTTAAMLIRGFKQQGLRVGAAKVTGTGAGCDRWVMTDAGADRMIDFTDLGEPSTYGLPPQRIEQLLQQSVAYLSAEGMEVIVVEVADGLLQQETSALIESPLFHSTIDGLLFAASDAMGALAGVQLLQSKGLEPLAVSGAMTASPLATQEARELLEIPVATSDQLAGGHGIPHHPSLPLHQPAWG
ncbi:DUF1611 domain-containing protein [Aestuariirhabdus litorea]|uniref:DUF1611 domain-containing protein n=1 Tax=Aestuariirhabdus litorea TaxID=2528527 RepID=A0A3P3VKP9_9GAMM|nr:DUF1611 domain-containing protein [Aestuariirhabdus litorea]RRJ83321.1 DUF1611 domain-containing protein [Aestuariirhabdus litorea]RWW93481.1 DUF1611 domain-containing protein [Endozoicomonadaceae bacterium GTF-13]